VLTFVEQRLLPAARHSVKSLDVLETFLKQTTSMWENYKVKKQEQEQEQEQEQSEDEDEEEEEEQNKEHFLISDEPPQSDEVYELKQVAYHCCANTRLVIRLWAAHCVRPVPGRRPECRSRATRRIAEEPAAHVAQGGA